MQEVALNANAHVVYGGGHLLHWGYGHEHIPAHVWSDERYEFCSLKILVCVPGRKRTGLLNGANAVFLNSVRNSVQQQEDRGGMAMKLGDMLVLGWTMQAGDRRDKGFGFGGVVDFGEGIRRRRRRR